MTSVRAMPMQPDRASARAAGGARGAVLAVSAIFVAGCSQNNSPGPPVDAGVPVEEPVIEAAPEDAPLTPEGCQQGQTCQCVGTIAACVGPGAETPCTTAAECTVNNPVAICAMGADGGVCTTRCAREAGACSSTLCPTGYVCQQPPTGTHQQVCVAPSALAPLSCNNDYDCQYNGLPDASCKITDTGGGPYCILPCVPP